MKSINEVTLLGHLGQSPQFRHTQTGLPVCNFSIATNEVFGNGDEKQEKTTWHSVIAWKTLAENCQKFLDKGSRVLVRGRLQTRDYEFEGQKQTKVEVVASYVVFLDSKNESVVSGDIADENVPF